MKLLRNFTSSLVNMMNNEITGKFHTFINKFCSLKIINFLNCQFMKIFHFIYRINCNHVLSVVFTILGALCVLQSDNGGFVNNNNGLTINKNSKIFIFFGVGNLFTKTVYIDIM